MQIRPMELKDLELVAVLAGQLGYPTTLDQILPRYQEVTGLSGLFVAESAGGDVVGWVQVNREAQNLVSEARAEICALIVDENHRGLEIGAQLVQAAEAWAREKNLDLVRVRSNVTRERAHKFYQREGYSIKKSWHLFVKNLL